MIRGDWCLGLKLATQSFINTTNNRLERLNGQLKQVISRNSSLEEFIEKFYVIQASLRNEHNHKTALQFHKVRTSPYQPDSPESHYMKLLTTHAFQMVLRQLELHSKVTG